MRFLIVMILVFCILGCTSRSKGIPENKSKTPEDYVEALESNNQYARGFDIKDIDGGYLLSMMDPWNSGEVFARYEIKTGDQNSISRKASLLQLSPPFDRWVVSSTTHIGFLIALGEEDKIVGCTSPDRIFDQKLSRRFNEGKIKKIGSDMEFNFESVLGIEPDIILQTAFEGQRKKDQRFLSAGLEFMYILEWMEPHPLGRAEWIKVFGLLSNKMEEADSIFSQIEDEYNQIKSRVIELTNKPLVMIGNNFGGTWYMPGGQNYMCRFLEDAGFEYPYLKSEDRGSLALNFENVLEQFRTADIWLGVSANGLDDLAAEDSRYIYFEPFKNQKVYSVKGRMNANLGNDFWESGVVYPNLILADLVSIAHSEVMDGHQAKYYKLLKSEK